MPDLRGEERLRDADAPGKLAAQLVAADDGRLGADVAHRVRVVPGVEDAASGEGGEFVEKAVEGCEGYLLDYLVAARSSGVTVSCKRRRPVAASASGPNMNERSSP